jgi:hypothetical protein
MLVLLLLTTATPTKGDGACTTEPANPCLKSCTYQGTNYSFNFSGFAAQGTTPYQHARDPAEHDFYWDACDVLSEVKCSGSGTSNPVAVYSFGAPAPQPPILPQDSCAALGDRTTRKCTMAANYPRLQVVCSYAGGDGNRTVDIRYTCDGRYASYAQQQGAASYFVLDSVGPAACAMHSMHGQQA